MPRRSTRKILFLPSHIGLGHVARDLAIARILKLLDSEVRVDWCSAEPAISYLELHGCNVLEKCRAMHSMSGIVEELFNKGLRGVGGLKGLGEKLGILRRNWGVVEGIIDRYDLVVADEFWELVYAAPPAIRRRVVFLTDIVYMPYSFSALGTIGSLAINAYFRKALQGFRRLVYLNSLAEVRGRRWFIFLGGRVDKWIAENAFVAGYAPSYVPGKLLPKRDARRMLGIDMDEFVVVVTVGGTSAGSRRLLDCIYSALPTIGEEVRRRTGRELLVIVVRGPRTEWRPPSRSPVRMRVLGMVRDMTILYSAADAFITRSGRTTTADLLCASLPAVLIPIRGHMEQEAIAKAMSSLYGYPTIREYRCSPHHLAEELMKSIENKPKPPTEECLGGVRTAHLLLELVH